MVEQLHVFQQPQNDVLVYENHVLFQYYFVNDCFFQKSMCIFLACNFNVQVEPSFYFIFSQLNIYF